MPANSVSLPALLATATSVMASHITPSERSAWEERMFRYPPPVGIPRNRVVSGDRSELLSPNLLKRQWFMAMTGVPWDGSQRVYDRAKRAWANEFRTGVWIARHAAEITSGSSTLCDAHPFDVGHLSEDLSQCKVCSYCGALCLVGEVREDRKRSRDLGTTVLYGVTCCGAGKVSVAAPSYVHFEGLQQMLFAHGSDSLGLLGSTLRRHSVPINNAIAMAHQQVTRVRSSDGSNWMPTVIIQGRLNHLISSMATPDGRTPNYSQLMVYDPSADDVIPLDIIMGRMYLPRSTSLPERQRVTRIVSYLFESIRRHNPYASDFVLAMQSCKGKESEYKIVIDPTMRPTGTHARSFNVAQGYGVGGATNPWHGYKEVSVMLASDPTRTRGSLTLELSASGLLVQIDNLNRAFDPLRYVFLFPNGEDGYHDGRRMTMLEYYAYRLHWRQNQRDNNTLLMGGRLLQEYCCMAFAKVESSRLLWHTLNQKVLRSEIYQNLVDHVHSGMDTPAGKRIVLGASFVGGDRYQSQSFHDAMAVVRDRGRPSLFITFTCNPNWPEIKKSLPAGVNPPDRPDVTSRIFYQKYRELLVDLTEKHVLGPTSAYLSVIEFQKRGLPHAHILLIFNSYGRVRTPAEVDRIVSAELPELPPPGVAIPADAYARIERLQRLVCEHMLHDNCLLPTSNKRCRDSKTGRCSKGFPRAQQPATTWTDESIYPLYRRRPLSTPILFRGKPVSNQWVVPYNPWLLSKYESHINVEVCVGSGGIKYVYKYLAKNLGHGDRAMVTVDRSNEPGVYQQFRTIGACEAAWRLFKFEMSRSAPCVERLPVHLHHQHQVRYEPGAERDAVAAGPDATRLTEFLSYILHPGRTAGGEEHAQIARFTYPTWPGYASWDDRTRVWKPRVRDVYNRGARPVGRMYYVHPDRGELFYLQMLLGHETVEAIQSHAIEAHGVPADGLDRSLARARELGVNLVKFGAETFQSACVQRGYLQSMDEWFRVMDVAESTQMSHRLRFVFVSILHHNSVSEPTRLFETYWKSMSEFGREGADASLYALVASTPPSHTRTVWSRLVVLDAVSEDLENLGPDGQSQRARLPDISAADRRALDTAKGFAQSSLVVRRETSYDASEEKAAYDNAYEKIKLCDSQRCLVDSVVSHMESGKQLCVFLDAPGGTGKTFCLNALLSHVRGEKKIALAVASTGIAALLLNGGTTIHSRFKIPINLTAETVCGLSWQCATAKLLRQTALIVYDESPMHHRFLMEALDRTLRDVRESSAPFGGVSVVFAGDFRQILPIVPHTDKSSVIAACLHQSPLWAAFAQFRLTENMRVRRLISGALRSRLEDFSTWLLKVGEGRIGVGTGVSDDGGSLSTVTLGGFEVRHTDMSANGITQMLAWTYGSLSDAVTGSADDAALIALFASRIVMAPLHCCVDKVNDVAIGMLRTTEWVCKSADAVEEDSDQYPITPDVLAALDPPNMPPSVLTLKQGMPVILMRNLRPEQGLCNGTRLLVRRVIDNALLEAVVLSGHRRFIGTAVTLTRIKLIEDQHSPYKWSRLAFPVKPAFGLTINKSQGQTMDRVAVCLEQPCFSHGQLYVAASRLGDPSELSFWLDSDARGETLNVVYPEALLTGATSEQSDGD